MTWYRTLCLKCLLQALLTCLSREGRKREELRGPDMHKKGTFSLACAARRCSRCMT